VLAANRPPFYAARFGSNHVRAAERSAVEKRGEGSCPHVCFGPLSSSSALVKRCGTVVLTAHRSDRPSGSESARHVKRLKVYCCYRDIQYYDAGSLHMGI